MNKLDEKSKHSLTTRVITSIILAIVTIPCCLLGGWFILILALILLCIGIFEILRAPGEKTNIFVWIVTYCFAVSFLFWPFIKNKRLLQSLFIDNTFYMSVSDFSISLLAMLGFLLILFVISIFDEKFMPKNVFYTFTMTFLVSIGMLSMLFIRYLPSTEILFKHISETNTYIVYGYHANSNGVQILNTDLRSVVLFFYLIIGTFATDIGAYFTGILFGKHKMNERISPKKTWEGFAGGVAFSIILSISYAALFEFAFNIPLLPNILSFRSYDTFGSTIYAQPFWFIILLSCVMPITSNVGDFLFSDVKRHFNLKDFSNVFPGHGGFLDRFDSIIVTYSVCALVIAMIACRFDFIKIIA